jgi:hypothetical protein
MQTRLRQSLTRPLQAEPRSLALWLVAAQLWLSASILPAVSAILARGPTARWALGLVPIPGLLFAWGALRRSSVLLLTLFPLACLLPSSLSETLRKERPADWLLGIGLLAYLGLALLSLEEPSDDAGRRPDASAPWQRRLALTDALLAGVGVVILVLVFGPGRTALEQALALRLPSASAELSLLAGLLHVLGLTVVVRLGALRPLERVVLQPRPAPRRGSGARLTLLLWLLALLCGLLVSLWVRR